MAVVMESEGREEEARSKQNQFRRENPASVKRYQHSRMRASLEPSLEFHLCFIRVLSLTRCNVVPGYYVGRKRSVATLRNAS